MRLQNRTHSSFIIHHSHFRERGQAVVEYAIVFPVQLMLTLAIIQLAHIFVAKQVLEYAAFCGARAALVDADYERAAYIPISAIAGTSGVSSSDDITLPGWGTLRKSGAAEQKTEVIVEDRDEHGSRVARCEIEHEYELQVPMGNYAAYQLGDVFLSSERMSLAFGDVPHLRMKASCTLAQPWEE